jgi:adenine-specific DNA-methyltransferase
VNNLNIFSNSASDLLTEVELIRIRAAKALDPKKKSELGQFFTPSPIASYMASLFAKMSGNIRLLDPGCGPGSLFTAFAGEALKRGQPSSIHVDAFDIENTLAPYLSESLNICAEAGNSQGVKFSCDVHLDDFILSNSSENIEGTYTHCILNPPYKKISSSSAHRKALRKAGIETVNLYTGFLALAIKLLKQGGEIVAIIPRSFTNGPYYLPFRKLLLSETSIKHIHIFGRRDHAFSDDDVLQENIIIHCIKGAPQKEVVVTSSTNADFHIDPESKSITATDLTTRRLDFSEVVVPNDPQQFIHLTSSAYEQAIVNRLRVFTASLPDIGVEVSTGPVVDFRAKKDLRQQPGSGSVPLLYPVHLKRTVDWPVDSKKPNAIAISPTSRPQLWENKGWWVITRRFSSKDEKRRIVATLYDSSAPGEFIGYENKLNVFHATKRGFSESLAKGLFVYLNSSLVDKYYRLFGGHTQVNATDLRGLHYPPKDSLERIGLSLRDPSASQQEIDALLDKEINKMAGKEEANPLKIQEKIDETLELLIELGMPRAQQNERSALTFLALLGLAPEMSWQSIERPILGVTPIMDWVRDTYGKEYAPNTRETFRRQTLHQFVAAGIALYNPDKPDRPVNSPKACYQIAPELHGTLLTYKTAKWKNALAKHLGERETLVQQYAMEREMKLIPLNIDGTEIKLSPGVHSKLIRDIITEFGPRFAPGSEVIYVGDTGQKHGFFRENRLAELGVVVDAHGKLPDVVLYQADKDWLFLIEAVTSHGPVDGKRHAELSELFATAKPGLVYVTAFPNRKTMGGYIADISWETEVWTSDAPTHLIHFNGDRFLGPHS